MLGSHGKLTLGILRPVQADRAEEGVVRSIRCKLAVGTELTGAMPLHSTHVFASIVAAHSKALSLEMIGTSFE